MNLRVSCIVNSFCNTVSM